MTLYIPYGYTPYESTDHYGVFSTEEEAKRVLEKHKKEGYKETYAINPVQVDVEDLF